MTLEITSSHVEAALRHIVTICGTQTFTDWVRVVRVNTRRRLSDHLVYDLKRDNTLPESFDSLDDFRSYLISQHACAAALSLAPRVWKRYQRWVAAKHRAGLAVQP